MVVIDLIYFGVQAIIFFMTKDGSGGGNPSTLVIIIIVVFAGLVGILALVLIGFLVFHLVLQLK